jgi:hypothetical protein
MKMEARWSSEASVNLQRTTWRYIPEDIGCSAQADWTLTHRSYKYTEQSTIQASITLDGVTLTDLLIR